MASIISTFSLTTVVLVLLIGVPSLFNFVKWCKDMWKSREEFKQENIQKGKDIEAKAEAKEARLQEGESRMTHMENDIKDLKLIISQQKELIELLIKSDELDIKSWIKMQHEKWIPRGCIDSQTLDLLEQRYEIYSKEGGNSWALKLLKEMRALPAVTVVPVTDIHENGN